MNLTKLFNFKYLLQNIKKSKMAIALFMLIVPLMTSLMMISQSSKVYSFMELSGFNIFGMYVIPFIFSVCFFGYVFKKKSVDFMGSMPISRKTIFVTNTIGGIGLIIILQVITFLLTMLLGSIISSTVFVGMALDILLYMTVSYIFVFTVANLAMSVSGNVLTQIVVTLLILCLIPVSYTFIELFENSGDICVTNGSLSIHMTRGHQYTAPLSFLSNSAYTYNVGSMIKMGALSVIYFAIGLYAFSKRKMEIAEESFEKKNTHLIVKGLTLTPFVMILIATIDSHDEELLPIILGIMIIYYFLYDLITNKKMKFKDNIISFCFATVVLYGTLSLGIAIEDALPHKIDVDDISEITIKNDYGFEYTFKDKKDFNKVLGSLYNEYTSYNKDYTYCKVSVKTHMNVMATERRVFVNTDELFKVLPKASRKTSLGSKIVIDSQYVDLTAEEESKLKGLIEKETQIFNFGFEKYSRDEIKAPYTISVFGYNNHSLVEYKLPINLSDEIFDLLVKAFNRRAKQVVDDEREFWWNDLARVTNGNTTYLLARYDYDYNEVRNMIAKAINTSFEEKVNQDDLIRVNGKNFVFFTSDMQGIMRTISTFGERKYDDEAYYKDYERDGVTSFPEISSSFVTE